MPLYARLIWITASPDEAAPALEAHRDHVRALAAAGRLRAGGTFPDGDGVLEIFEARDRLDAEAVARTSPLIESGLGSWVLREWVEWPP
jgi:uncharacterized protein YciI